MQKSYVKGTTDKPLIKQTIGDYFDMIVHQFGNREALVVCHQNIRWTYQDFAEHVSKFAAGLIAIGLKPGDRLGIWAPNCAEWAIVQFATAKVGIIMVNINPAYRLSELEYALNKAGCKGLISADQFKSSNYIAMIQELIPEVEESVPGQLHSEKIPCLETIIRLGDVVTPGFYNFDEITAMAAEDNKRLARDIQACLSCHDEINIQFTSGTTGMPKGATLTHYNILNNSYFCGQAMNICEQDRLCIPVPLYHCFGMVLGNLTCMAHGACMVYPNDAFDPLKTLQVIETDRCTALHGVPTMFISMLDHSAFSGFDLSSLRTGVMAGSPCPVEVMERVIDRMHMEQVTIGYGMTETSPLSFQSSTIDLIEQRVSTVGQVLPHTEVKIVNEDGDILPTGEKGELLT